MRKARKPFDFDKRNAALDEAFALNQNPDDTEVMALALKLKASGLYSATTYLGDITRGIKRRFHELRVQGGCSHKFVDSKVCLKCGWKPPANYGKTLAQVFTEEQERKRRLQ